MSKEQETAMYDEPDYGPICCKGGCCGPGSYCCGHPDNEHDHPELEEPEQKNPFCDQCSGPYTEEQGGDPQYAGRWDTCPNRWEAKRKRDQALIDDEVTLGMVKVSPEFDLAMWFHCLLVGHKWKWLVRLIWPDEDSPLTYGIRPVAERCKRCGSRRPLNMFRWVEFLSGGRHG